MVRLGRYLIWREIEENLGKDPINRALRFMEITHNIRSDRARFCWIKSMHLRQ